MKIPYLKHRQIVKLARLLDMLYKPAEIAEEIGVTPETIYRSYLPAGLPYTRDEQGNIWIHGPAFVGWAHEMIARRKNERVPLADDQAWCLKCRGPVPLINPKVKKSNRYLELLQSRCPYCSSTVNRARARQVGGAS